MASPKKPSVDCLIKRFDSPKAPGPSCRPELPADRIHTAALALREREGLEEALRLRFADVETVLANLQAYNAGLVDDLREFRSRK